MKKGCFLSLFIYLAFGAGAYYYFHPRYSPPGDWIAALVVAFIASMSVGALNNARQAIRDRKMLGVGAGGIAGGIGGGAGSSGTFSLGMGMPTAISPKDGAEIAVAGVIRPIGAALRSPFGNSECVFYEYDITHTHQFDSDSSPNEVKDYNGVALTPCVIESPTARYKLLSYPQLEGFDKIYCESEPERAAATAYLANTKFETMGLGKIKTVFKEFKDLFSDSDGEFRKDYKMGEVADLGECSLTETVVRAGDQVCAFGIYNAAQQGLMADLKGRGVLLRVILGDRAQIRSRLSRKVINNLFGSVAFLAASAIPWGVLELREKSLEPAKQAAIADHNHELPIAAAQGNLDKVKQLLDEGISPNVKSQDSQSALMLSSSPEISQLLIDRGADINQRDRSGQTALIIAADRDNAEIVRFLIDHHADVNVTDERSGRSALSQAQEHGRADIVEMLQRAGAVSDVVTTSNGTPLPADGGPQFQVCKAYLEGIQSNEGEKLRELVYRWPEDFFTSNMSIYADIRPITPTFVEGFVKGNKATLRVNGQTQKGYAATWVYQMILDGGKWKIQRENWDTSR